MASTNTNSRNFTSMSVFVPKEALQSMPLPESGQELAAESQIFYELYSRKFMEIEDRKSINNFGRSMFTYFVLSSFTGIVLNRMLTLARFGKFDFLNLNLFFRVPIRLSIFGFSYVFLFVNPSLKNFDILRASLNEKYVPRYKKFNETGDFRVLNSKLFDDPSMTAEEKQALVQLIEQMKQEIAYKREIQKK